jgi:predicted methyltransferase
MIVLSRFTAAPLLQTKSGTVPSSADLGVTGCSVEVNENGATFPDGTIVGRKALEKIAKSDRGCFEIIDGEAVAIQQFSETTGYMRSLAATKGAPTMLVSGIPMHRIKNIDPMDDTKNKIEAIGSIHGKVLDTATGLGYTAIMAAKKADNVVTVEIDPVGIEIAKRNPWSRELFDNPKIEIQTGDIDEVIDSFPAGEFSAIIHDPPTFQFAGELYSLEFYEKLFRVLSRKGTLFHYIADPDSKLGGRMTKGVMRRLHEAGFAKVERRPKAFGVIARK